MHGLFICESRRSGGAYAQNCHANWQHSSSCSAPPFRKWIVFSVRYEPPPRPRRGCEFISPASPLKNVNASWANSVESTCQFKNLLTVDDSSAWTAGRPYLFRLGGVAPPEQMPIWLDKSGGGPQIGNSIRGNAKRRPLNDTERNPRIEQTETGKSNSRCNVGFSFLR